MNILFFIGNGFDLNLGLNTRYTNFYPYFIASAPESNMIRNWIENKEYQWSDLEKKLGEELVRVSADSIMDFIWDKGELDHRLCQYLRREEERVDSIATEEIRDEFVRSIKEFDKDLPEAYRRELKCIKDAHKNEEFCYHFVTYNYTQVLDRIVKAACKNGRGRISNHISSNGTSVREDLGNVIHVHGTTEDGMILGVNDIEQIGNRELRGNSQLLQSFIKPNMLQINGRSVQLEIMNLLYDSHIACIYGMSLGETDALWWEILIKWLCIDNNRLIIFAHADKQKTIKVSASMNTMETGKVLDRFLGRRNVSDEIRSVIESRIFVMFTPSIFKFNSV